LSKLTASRTRRVEFQILSAGFPVEASVACFSQKSPERKRGLYRNAGRAFNFYFGGFMPPIVAAVTAIVTNVALFTGLQTAVVAGIEESEETVFVDGWPEVKESQ
jgi:hypothetical protein